MKHKHIKRAKPYIPMNDSKIYIKSTVTAGLGMVTHSATDPNKRNVLQIDMDEVKYMTDLRTVYCTNQNGFFIFYDNYGIWQVRPVVPISDTEMLVFGAGVGASARIRRSLYDTVFSYQAGFDRGIDIAESVIFVEGDSGKQKQAKVLSCYKEIFIMGMKAEMEMNRMQLIEKLKDLASRDMLFARKKVEEQYK